AFFLAIVFTTFLRGIIKIIFDKLIFRKKWNKNMFFIVIPFGSSRGMIIIIQFRCLTIYSLLIYADYIVRKKETNIRPKKIIMNETKEFSLPSDGNSSPPELLGFTRNTNQMESSCRKE
ncbi:hypothetical protein, partial [Bacillus wiedmannii]|uniref:hypothetical protein n=1 Tax=Bacillus wiedmannii TaxID=1890302 RepID=UPI0019D51C8A